MTTPGHDNKRSKATSDAGDILGRMLEGDAELKREVEEARLNVRIAEMLYEARMASNLTQSQLAELVGTTQSVISRLEDADYEGHSLPMLQRVAAALHRRVEVNFPPEVA